MKQKNSRREQIYFCNKNNLLINDFVVIHHLQYQYLSRKGPFGVTLNYKTSSFLLIFIII